MPEGNGFVMKDGETKKKAGTPMPKIDFSSFILSIYSSGLVQLGKVEDPSSGQKSPNLGMVKHTVEMMVMLQEKTRGNLTGDEENLLKTLLSELRMAYVEARS